MLKRWRTSDASTSPLDRRNVVERLHRIDRPDLALRGSDERGWVAGAAQDVGHRGERHLRLRDEDFRPCRTVEAVVANLADDADHFRLQRLPFPLHPDSAPDRTLGRPLAPSQRLADDRDGRRALVVPALDQPPLPQRDRQRLEIARRHDREVRAPPIGIGRGIAPDNGDRGLDIDVGHHEWHRRHRSRGLDARNGPHPLKRGREEGPGAVGGVVTVPGEDLNGRRRSERRTRDRLT